MATSSPGFRICSGEAYSPFTAIINEVSLFRPIYWFSICCLSVYTVLVPDNVKATDEPPNISLAIPKAKTWMVISVKWVFILVQN